MKYQKRNNSNWNSGSGRYSASGQQKKHSGAKRVSNGKNDGGTNVSAWNYSRQRGLVSILIFPTKFSDEPSKSGGLKLCAKVTFKRTGEERLISCIKSSKNGKYYIAKMGLCINPSAPNGGYCGTSNYTK